MFDKKGWWQVIIIVVVVGALGLGFIVSKKLLNKSFYESKNPLTPAETETSNQKADKTAPLINQKNRELLDINMYLVLFGQFLTLVRQAEIPGTNITEHIWGFSLRGQDYRFRTYNVACQLPGTAAYPGYSETLGGQFESLEIGQNYNVAFFGLLESPTENELRLASNDCKTVLRGLRTDSEDMERLRKFFATRDTAGFAVDENGIMDLTKVITVIQVDKL